MSKLTVAQASQIVVLNSTATSVTSVADIAIEVKATELQVSSTINEALQVIALHSTGVEAKNIAKQLKVSKGFVEQAIKSNKVEEVKEEVQEEVQDEVKEEVKEEVVKTEAPKSTTSPTSSKISQLQAMMSATKKHEAAKEVLAPQVKASRGTSVIVKVQRSSSKDAAGDSRQRRNYAVTERKITVFKSASLNQAFVATNLAFTVRTHEAAMNYAKRDKALVKRTGGLFLSSDLVMEIQTQEVNIGEELNVAKARAMDQLTAEGYSVLGKRPKVAVTELPAQQADTAPDTALEGDTAPDTALEGEVQA